MTDWSIRFSRVIIILTVVLALGVGFFIKDLHFDNDMTNWTSEKDETGYLQHYTAKKFGSTTPIMLEFKFSDCFSRENLALIKEVSDAVEKMNDVDTVLSLANIDDVASAEGTIKVEKLVRYPLPQESTYYENLKNYVLSKKGYSRMIVSKDATTAMMLIKPKNDSRSDLVAMEIRKNVQTMVEGKNVTVYYGGLPTFINSITEIVLKDFIVLIPLVIFIVVAVLFISFRKGRGIGLPLLSVGFAALLAMGLMGLLHIPLNIMSVVIPVVLVACGNAYGIHVLNRYYEKVTLFNDKKEIIRQVMREISLPVILSGLTAAFGFFSLATAQISLIRDFGIYTGIGVLFATFISLIFIPAYLYLAKKQKCFHMEKADGKTVKVGKIARSFTSMAVKHHTLLIVVGAVLLIGGIIIATRLESKIDYLAYFDKQSEPRVVADYTMEKFGGYFPYNVYVKADIKNPAVLKTLLIAEERMRLLTGLNPNGIADMIAELNHAMTGIRTIPETEAEVENLWFFIEGNNQLASIVTKDKSETLISCLVNSTDPQFIGGLENDLNTYFAPYRKKIVSVKNTPDNPELHACITLFMTNLLTENKITFKPEELKNGVDRLMDTNKNYSPEAYKEQLELYLAGDESEIAFSPEEARQIALAVSGLMSQGESEIISLLKKAVPPSDRYDDSDAKALARSILMMSREEMQSGKIGKLIAVLRETFPTLKTVPDADVSYTVAPFIWQTIPSSNSDPAAPVSETAVQEMGQTGYAYVAELIRREIVRDQIISLAITLLAVLVFIAIVFRSLKEGLVSMIAMPFTLIINYALMALLRIPLDIATVTVGSISIIGIDYTLHFIARYSIEMKKNGADKIKAFQITFATAGKAILFNALSVGLGFAVLCFSSITAIRNLGLLLAVTMLVSCLTSLTLLPAVMSWGNILKREKKAG
jgi:predicted RND superfamily exporter protein